MLSTNPRIYTYIYIKYPIKSYTSVGLKSLGSTETFPPSNAKKLTNGVNYFTDTSLMFTIIATVN